MSAAEQVDARKQVEALDDLERLTWEYAASAERAPAEGLVVSAGCLAAGAGVAYTSPFAAHIYALLALPVFLLVMGVARWSRQDDPEVTRKAGPEEARQRRGMGWVLAMCVAWTLLTVFWARWPHEVTGPAVHLISLALVGLVASTGAGFELVRGDDEFGVALLLGLGAALLSTDQAVELKGWRELLSAWPVLALALAVYGVQRLGVRRDLARRMATLRVRTFAGPPSRSEVETREELGELTQQLGRLAPESTELAEWVMLPWMVFSLVVSWADRGWGVLAFIAGPVVMLACLLVVRWRAGNKGETSDRSELFSSGGLMMVGVSLNGLGGLMALALGHDLSGGGKLAVAACLAAVLIALTPVASRLALSQRELTLIYSPWFASWLFLGSVDEHEVTAVMMIGVITSATLGVVSMATVVSKRTRRRRLRLRIASLQGEGT